MRAWTKRKNSLETYVILSAAGVAGRAKKPSLVGHNSIFPGSRKKGHWAGPHIRYPWVLLAKSTGSLVPLSRRGEAVRGLLNAGLKSEVADPRPHQDEAVENRKQAEGARLCRTRKPQCDVRPFAGERGNSA